jgi:acetylglutamate kinase
MDDAIRKAGVLIEALGYIRRFRSRFSVIKLGGSAMEDASALRATLQDIVFMETVGLRPIIVHGGGKPIDRAMAAAGIEPRKIRGHRVTDERALEIVVRVLLDEVNANIVREIRNSGGRAVGLHSSALQCLFGTRTTITENGETLDLGRVGRVTRVDAGLIQDFGMAGVVPVIPCLVWDEEGHWLNVNADSAAAAVAAQLGADKLVFLTDTAGILRDRGEPDSRISSLDAPAAQELIRSKVIDQGMIPKVEAGLDGLKHGVRKTHIIDGRVAHSLLLEIFTDQGVGTEIRQGLSSPENAG